jgi:hypothetical protein
MYYSYRIGARPEVIVNLTGKLKYLWILVTLHIDSDDGNRANLRNTGF